MPVTTTVSRWAQIAMPIMTLCAAAILGATPASAATPDPAAADAAWRPAGCPPAPETGSGKSNVKVTGPCGFEHKGDADCEASGDDMMLVVSRKGRNGAEVMLYINVERYVGPGTYKPPNDMWVSVLDGSKIWRWFGRNFVAKVGPESKSVMVTDVRLDPELLLVGCTGPQTDYQCDGRGDDPKHMQSLTTVSGTIACKSLKTAG